jgi:hypothetical protein
VVVRSVVALLSALGASFGLVTPAAGASVTHSAAEVASAVSEALTRVPGERGGTTPSVSLGHGIALARHTQAISVSLPRRLADPVSASVSGHTVEIGLPGTGSDGLADTGFMTRTLIGTHTSQLVQKISGGFRATIVLHDVSAPTRYAYKVRGAVPFLLADGEVLLRSSNGDVLGLVEAPWAVDARGHMVRTSYEVHGDELIQNLESGNVTFPVVMDPTVTFGWYIYVRLSASDRRDLVTDVVAAGGAISGEVICAEFGPFGAVCAALGGVGAWFIAATVYDEFAVSPNCGMEFVFYYSANLNSMRFIYSPSDLRSCR